MALSFAVHLALLPILAFTTPPPPKKIAPPPPPPILVTLSEPPPPPLPPAPEPAPASPKPDPAPAAPAAKTPTPAPQKAAPAPKTPQPPRPTQRPHPAPPTPRAPAPHRTPRPAPPSVETRPVAEPGPDTSNLLTEAQLVGATTAGSSLTGGPGAGAAPGGGTGAGAGAGSGNGSGGRCDMVQRLQDALRDDPRIRAAVTRAHEASGTGQAMLVWNGDWIRSQGQDGKGLAGVRQAIALEVAFAPPACRSQAMRGLVLLRFSDAPGGPRLALGTRSWRWSDLTHASGAAPASIRPGG